MTSTNAAVRRAAAPDATALGRCIGAAFARDPVSRWTFGSPAAIEAAYQLMAERLYVPAGHSTVIEGGGALWLGPGQPKPLTLLDRFAMGRALTTLAGPRHPWRAIRVDRAMRARRPRTPHAYLFAIGVLPEARGRGVGRALLDHTLRLADRQGLPCYLENTNPVNTPIYTRFGFRAEAPFEPAPGCPPLVPMWRAPRRA